MFQSRFLLCTGAWREQVRGLKWTNPSVRLAGLDILNHAIEQMVQFGLLLCLLTADQDEVRRNEDASNNGQSDCA
ncbi:unnamed protein product (mitochondrion) [Plasmodiophora brassicae]|uniref:Uncharacterized protein n=1 Tax=Plasmodiophora brassicae TaxID=37360 RepID=A0A3P3YG58_PLABS|nr:unnamed protein product [Plasmodiophora brassicae]